MRDNEYIIIIDIFIMIALGIIHFVFYFFIEPTDFNNIIDAFESSPLFDFTISDNCGAYENLMFHRWEGRKETEYYRRNGKRRSRTVIYDETDITLINGHKFCYNKKKTYKELLNNGQIIKKGESCNNIFTKNCGTIDTLEQELCVKENEACPLYDVRINPDYSYQSNNNYNTDSESKSNIYYNNNNYNADNKKIIGKILLNHGKPCYNINEQLWKHFNDDEAGEEHLKCELEIFGKKNEERYEEIGKISYWKIYYDNLATKTKSWDLFKNIGESEKLTFYKREFIGIDKECNDKNDVFNKTYDKLIESQNQEKDLLLAESIIIFVIFAFSSAITIKIKSSKDCLLPFSCITIILSFLAFIISGSVFLGKMVEYSDLSYDCSDKITNEVLKKNSWNTTKQIVFTAINLGFDVLFTLFNIIAYTYEKIYDFFVYDFRCFKCNCECDCVCPCKKKYKISSNDIKIDNNNDFVYHNEAIQNNPTINKNFSAPRGPIPDRELIINQNAPAPNPQYF